MIAIMQDSKCTEALSLSNYLTNYAHTLLVPDLRAFFNIFVSLYSYMAIHEYSRIYHCLFSTQRHFLFPFFVL